MTTIDHPLFRKPADAQYPIHDLIRERWSPRAFADRPVAAEKLNSLFEAARWAASSGNLQPWRFVIATQEKPEDHARFVSTLFDRNARWAQYSPVLILVVAELYPYPGKEQTSFYDVGMAVENLVIQAIELGLATHQMGGVDHEKARAVLNIPDGYAPLTMIALGYPGDPAALPDDLREREIAPRSRKALQEFVFEGQWAQTAPEV